VRIADRIGGLLPESFDAILVAGGKCPRKDVLDVATSRSQTIVAIDGGLAHLRHFGIAPQYVVGDLDSARADDIAWARRRRARVVFRARQQDSDFDKALILCEQKKWKSVAIVGIDGHRVDHFLNSLGRVSATRNVTPVFLFQRAIGFVLRGPSRVNIVVGKKQTFSWLGFPLATGASLAGAVWLFNRRTLEFAGFQSLSNIATEENVLFSQKTGKSLIIIPIGKV